MSTREGISPEYAEVQSPVAPCTAGPTAPHRSSAPRMLRQIADADGASQDALRVDDGQAAGKCNKSLVGMFDAKQRAARLRQIADLPSRHAEEDRRFRFLDGNIDAAGPRVVGGFQVCP